MDLNIYYNNKVLSAQEREEFRIRSDEAIDVFAESIDGFYELNREHKPSQNKAHDKITKTVLDVGIFTSYTFCDCVALLKHFVLSSNTYDKSLFRGKLKVLLNEGFKNLYGFNDKQREKSYYIKLGEIINHFPGFKSEYNSILLKLKQLSEQSAWWKDERNIEVHLDMTQLYKSRHEEINESKVAMEAHLLIDLLVQINKLMGRMHQAYIDYMIMHLKIE
ncbi:MAG: hypothetical protein IKV83_00775 [Muribaculaceae bacterium]|nr:hypothetical protein [Muribaculaceae bacterium]